MATLADMAALYFFTELVGFYYVLSVMLAFPVGVLTNYFLNKFLNFRNGSKKYAHQIVKFTSVAVGGLFLHVVFVYGMVEFLGIWYMLAKAVTSGIVMFYSYFMHRWWTFNDDKPISKPLEFIVENKLLMLAILFVLVVNYLMILPLKGLPSPIYGGDYYYQLGQTNHVKFGGSPFDSAAIQGALPGYFVVYSFFTGMIAGIFNIDGVYASYIFSFIILVVSSVIVYCLVQRVMGRNELLGVIAVLAFTFPSYMPVVKYTFFALLISMPLFLLLLYNFMLNPSDKNGVLLGLAYSLAGLSHGIAFISASLLFAAFFVWKYVFARKRNLMPFVIVFVIGFSISLLYWFEPIFIHHGATSPHYADWNNQDWSSVPYQFKFFSEVVRERFANFGAPHLSIISLFTLLGIFSFLPFLRKRMPDNARFVLFLLVVAIIGTFHYFFTENLLGINFIPVYVSLLLLSPVLLLVFVCGAKYFSEQLKKDRARLVFFGVLIAVLAFNIWQGYENRDSDPFYQWAASTPPPPQLVALKDYLAGNTSVHDVILTTKENGFAVNALSGRKLVAVRRAQNDPFIDMDPRELASAIILYGSDTQKKLELIEKYNISYLYWDDYWQNSDYDPLLVFYSEENERLLQENGVKYGRSFTYVDPSMRGENYRAFDLLVVTQDNYFAFDHPWMPDLDLYLEKVWSYSMDGAEVARLYKIKKGDVLDFKLSSPVNNLFFKA